MHVSHLHNKSCRRRSWCLSHDVVQCKYLSLVFRSPIYGTLAKTQQLLVSSYLASWPALASQCLGGAAAPGGLQQRLPPHAGGERPGQAPWPVWLRASAGGRGCSSPQTWRCSPAGECGHKTHPVSGNAHTAANACPCRVLVAHVQPATSRLTTAALTALLQRWRTDSNPARQDPCEVRHTE